MGKASRNKKLKRQETEALKHYGNVKLSEALLTLCDPYIVPEMNKKRYEVIISLSAMVWNVATYPENIRTEKLIEMIQVFPELKGFNTQDVMMLMQNSTPNDPRDSVVILHIIFGMLQQKIKHYPDDDRVVVKYWLESKNGKGLLQVKSVTPDAEKNTHSVEA